MTEFTDRFVQAVRDTVARQGRDFVYAEYPADECLYNSGPNGCGCLFGEALRSIGHPVPEEQEGARIHTVLRDEHDFPDVSFLLPKVRYYGSDIPEDTETRVAMAAFFAQVKQDDGLTWGQALDKFESVLRGERQS